MAERITIPVRLLPRAYVAGAIYPRQAHHAFRERPNLLYHMAAKVIVPEHTMLITPLSQGFGAEVSQFDCAEGGAPEDIARLQQAYSTYHLLIFRSAKPLAPERQVEITGWFGTLLAEEARWTTLNNAEPSGHVVLPFHSDMSFLEDPLAGISLYPEALPRTATTTSFVSNALAWDRLTGADKQQLAGRRALHIYDGAANLGFDWPVFTYWHPACIAHAKTGRSMLFISEHHVEQIEGIEPAQCKALLQAVFAVLYAPEYRYEHIWHTGDLVVWDNFAIQHARPAAADPADGQRIMRRVQLGKAGFMAQAQRVRQASGG
ncbi:MAG: TauD/TfdA family dioxygenase [Alphaproteobacteria bacterium]|nr:TauD/TfdA family dioxygenase [Alphaproteobacteria bacterium]